MATNRNLRGGGQTACTTQGDEDARRFAAKLVLTLEFLAEEAKDHSLTEVSHLIGVATIAARDVAPSSSFGMRDWTQVGRSQ